MKRDEVKLDPYGEVDVDYYVELAKKQRQQAVAEMFNAAGGWFAKVLHVKNSAQQKAAH